MRKFKILLIFILLIICILTCSCSSDLFSNAYNKTVQIVLEEEGIVLGKATGFFIAKDLLLSNAHIIKNIESSKTDIYCIKYLQNKKNKLKIEKIDVQNDLLLLKMVEESNNKYFSISNKELEIGETVYTIGNPGGYGLSLSNGIISNTKVIISQADLECETIQLNLEITNGNSGGPVFNKKGEIVGIMSFKVKDENREPINAFSYAITAQKIKEFITKTK